MAATSSPRYPCVLILPPDPAGFGCQTDAGSPGWPSGAHAIAWEARSEASGEIVQKKVDGQRAPRSPTRPRDSTQSR